jgi:hypothetical protein
LQSSKSGPLFFSGKGKAEEPSSFVMPVLVTGIHALQGYGKEKAPVDKTRRGFDVFYVVAAISTSRPPER